MCIRDRDITVWINSPGGDVFAAAQIYNMLMDYKGHVTVKIDGLAASAASVIAMAGTKVLMSPVAMMMIHNPATIAIGDTAEMKKAIEMLDEVKESIMNAYEIKTGLNRTKISHLMDAESWFCLLYTSVQHHKGKGSENDCRVFSYRRNGKVHWRKLQRMGMQGQ